MFSAKGAVSRQPGAAPQALKSRFPQALKARFTSDRTSKCIRVVNRAFSADPCGALQPGALPQADSEDAAPLALR
jgi:hypothetical protein